MPPPVSSTAVSAAAALAVLLPTVLVGVVIGVWGRPEAAQAKSPVLATCEATLEHDGADVVILGNSKARSDLEMSGVEKALGTDRIARLNIDGTGAPVWYAAMQRCLYGGPSTPKLVLIYGTLGTTSRVSLQGEIDRTSLAGLEGETDPVLVHKVFGGEASSPFWDRVRARRTALHTALQDGLRDLAVGLVFAPSGPEGLLSSGRAYAAPALDRAFGEAAGSVEAVRARAIPIAEAEEKRGPAGARLYEDTLFPDFVALAQAHGARIIYVNAPLSDRIRPYDGVPEGMEREVVQGLNAAGAGYIDLSTLGLPETAFADGIHMNSAGRSQTTAALAERLAALGALGEGPLTRASVPHAPPHGTRTGTAPTLPAIEPTRGPWECGWEAKVPGLNLLSDSVLAAGPGMLSPLVVLEAAKPLTGHAGREDFDAACKGAFNHQGGVVKFSPTGGPAEIVTSRSYTLALSDDLPIRDTKGREGWWVYPGTTVQIEIGEAWDGPAEGFRVAVQGYAAGGAASPTVRMGDLAPTALDRTGTDAHALLAVPAPTAPWTITFTSPPDGPWLLIHRVVVGTPASPWYAVGRPATARTVELLGAPVQYARAPDPLPNAMLTKVAKHSGQMWMFDVPDIGLPDFEVIRDITGLSPCSPLRLFEDGVPVPGPGTLPSIIREKGHGGYQHSERKVYFSASDNSSPAENRRTYTIALDPERRCLTNRWLYPGDVATFAVEPKQLASLVTGATRFDLGAAAITRESSSASLHVRLRLRLGDVVLLEADTPLATLNTQPPHWELPSAVLHDSAGLVLELSTPAEAPYVVVTGAALVEPAASAFGD